MFFLKAVVYKKMGRNLNLNVGSYDFEEVIYAL